MAKLFLYPSLYTFCTSTVPLKESVVRALLEETTVFSGAGAWTSDLLVSDH